MTSDSHSRAGPIFLPPVQGDGFPLGVVELHAEPRIEDISRKASYIRLDGYHDEPATSPQPTMLGGQVIGPERENGCARQFSLGMFRMGKWTVVRYGHLRRREKTIIRRRFESMGLECDKMSKKAIGGSGSLQGLMGKLLADQAAVGGKAMTMDPH